MLSSGLYDSTSFPWWPLTSFCDTLQHPTPSPSGPHMQDAQGSTAEPERPAAPPSREIASTSDETADKLDAMMELAMQHLDRRWEEGQGSGAWQGLLSAFERLLLPTQRSKFSPSSSSSILLKR